MKIIALLLTGITCAALVAPNVSFARQCEATYYAQKQAYTNLKNANRTLTRAEKSLARNVNKCEKKKESYQNKIMNYSSQIDYCKSIIESTDLLGGLIGLADNCDASSFFSIKRLRSTVARMCRYKSTKEATQHQLSSWNANCATTNTRLQAAVTAAAADQVAKQEVYDAAQIAYTACLAAVSNP